MIRQRGGSHTHRREMQTAKAVRNPRHKKTTPGTFAIQWWRTQHRQSSHLPMYVMYNTSTVYTYHIIIIIHSRFSYMAAARALPWGKNPFPSKNFPLRPPSAFFSVLPYIIVHIILFLFFSKSWQKVKRININKAKEEGWLNLAGNRWVGTGTGFCFPARDGASPVGSSHVCMSNNNVTEGKGMFRKK